MPGQGVTIADVIEMNRISLPGSGVAFSPDGTKMTGIVWRGDLKSDRNVYSIIVMDTSGSKITRPEPVLEVEVATDGWQFREPIQKLSFISGGEALAFIGSLEGEPRQVYSIDLGSGEVKALTSHQSPVRDFSISRDGSVLMYSVPDPRLEKARPQMEREGFSVFETERTPPRGQWVAFGDWGSGALQFFLVREPGSQPQLIFDASDLKGRVLGDLEPGSYSGEGQYFTVLQSSTTFSVSPTGERVIIWPYVPPGEVAKLSAYEFYSAADEITDHVESLMSPRVYRVAAPFGLLDPRTGRIETLLDAPHDAFVANSRSLVWAPDGRSVVISSLLPLDSEDVTVNEKRSSGPPELIEVDVQSRSFVPLEVEEGWSATCWDAAEDTLTLIGRQRAGSRFIPPAIAKLDRRNGSWTNFRVIGEPKALNPWYAVAVTDSLVGGVKDSLTEAPEMAIHDLETGEVRILTDLNPSLRGRDFGEIEKLFWKTPHDEKSFGYLIKPLEYEDGKRYPLAFLLKDTGYDPDDNSYLIDGQMQLAGFAIQTLAASGIMVLFAPSPPSLRDVVDTMDEGDHIKAQIESGIDHLGERGLIDPMRVGLSGWSRAGYHVNKVLVISDYPFAAASLVDGGTSEYTAHGYASFIHGRPWKIEELKQIQTPILFEAHGLTEIYISGMFDAMDKLGKPVDCFFYPGGSHFLRLPLHRWGSLSRNVDWFRFWLQAYEDPDPKKQATYERWRRLKAIQDQRPGARVVPLG